MNQAYETISRLRAERNELIYALADVLSISKEPLTEIYKFRNAVQVLKRIGGSEISKKVFRPS